MIEGNLHPYILSDNIHDALGSPGCCNWAAGHQIQYASLGVALSLLGGCDHNINHLAFRKAMLARDMSVWGELHIWPHGAHSRGAKLGTYLRTKLRSMSHFRVGAHSLQGRIEMPQVPRHLRRCTFCATNAIGDERHCVFGCPHF